MLYAFADRIESDPRWLFSGPEADPPIQGGIVVEWGVVVEWGATR